MTECIAKPYYYSLTVKQKKEKVLDADNDPDYMGEASIFIERVPVEVDAVSLEAWLKRGICSETGKIEKMRKHVRKAEAAIRGIEGKVQEVPFLDVDAPSEKEAAAQRKQIADILNKEIDIWEGKLKKRRKVLQELEDEAEHMEIDLSVFEHDERSNTNSWLCIMPKRKARLAGKLCRKDDWHDYKLAVMRKGLFGEADSPPLVLYGRRSEFPVEYEDDRRVVNMRLVQVTRQRHGDGGMIREHPDEVRITPNWFYRGEFVKGKRHGRGKLSNYCSVYEGQFVDDRARHTAASEPGGALATFRYADGSEWVGEVGRDVQMGLSLFDGNEYSRGVPHGEGTFTFADGSRYVGRMHNGQVDTHGRAATYTDVHTGTFTGPFRRGMLNGPDCQVERTSPAFGAWTQTGYFKDDAMHRRGKMTLPPQKVVNAAGKRVLVGKAAENAPSAGGGGGGGGEEKKKADAWDDGITEYDGEWVDGVMHGLQRGEGGETALENRWVFEGLYRDGHREGQGEDLYCCPAAMALLQGKQEEDGPRAGESVAQMKIRKFKEAERKAHGSVGEQEDGAEGAEAPPGKRGKDDGTSQHRRLPCRYGGRWEKGFILSRGIHTQKLGPGRFAGQYAFGKRPGELPAQYRHLWDRTAYELQMLRDMKRGDVRHWRDHRRTIAQIARQNQHNYRAALLQQRISFFDDDLWEYMTPEEQALERNQKNKELNERSQRELKIAMRRKHAGR